MLQTVLNTISLYAIPAILLGIPLYGYVKKVKVYEVFVGGAKEGFDTAIRIIPYLVAMLLNY
jgi:spore maturation protein B